MSKEDKLYKPSMFTHTLEIHVVMVIIVMLASVLMSGSM